MKHRERFCLLETEARSSVVEHCLDVAGVSGSIPLVPTKSCYCVCAPGSYF